VAVLVISAACVGGCGAHNSAGNQLPREANGKSATSPIRLLDLDGKPFDVFAQHADSTRFVVALFTRSDCPISNRFAPEIARLCGKYEPRGIAFYLIYVDPREPPDAIRKHLRDYQYPCAGLQDPEHSLVALCHATTTPEAVVFDLERSIVYQGRISDQFVALGDARADATVHDLADALEAVVHGLPVAVPRTQAVGCLIGDLKN
jgi:hypothetical protein